MNYTLWITVVASIVILTIFPLIRFSQVRNLAWRNMWKHRTTSFLTIMGAMVGTSLITSALLLQTSLYASLDQYIERHFGPITVEVTGLTEGSSKKYPFGEQEVQEIQSLVGQNSLFEKSAPMVSLIGTIQKKNKQGQTIFFQPNVHIMAGDIKGLTEVDPTGVELLPTSWSDDGIVLTDRLAQQLEIQVNSTIEVQTANKKVKQLRVSSLIPEQGITGYLGSQNGLYTAFVTEKVARQLAGVESGYTSVLVTQAEEGQESSSLFGRETDYQESLVRFHANQQANGIEKFLPFFDVAAMVAVLVGLVLVLNMFRMVAEERTKELGIMRTFGMKRRELRRMLRAEGTLYALTSSLLGVWVGLGIGNLAVSILANSTELVVSNDFRYVFSVDLQIILIGFASGFGCIYLCMAWIAYQASKKQIVDMMDSVKAQLHTKFERIITPTRLAVTTLLICIDGLLAYFSLNRAFQLQIQENPQVTLMNILLVVGVTITTILFFLVGYPILISLFVKTFRLFGKTYGLLRMFLRYPLVNGKRTALIFCLFTFVLFLSGFSATVQAGIGQFVLKFDDQKAMVGFDVAASTPRLLGKQEEDHIHDEFLRRHPNQIKAFVMINSYQPKGSPDQIHGIDQTFIHATTISLVERDVHFSSDQDVWAKMIHDPNVLIASEGVWVNQQKVQVGQEIEIAGKKKKVIGIAKQFDESYEYPISYGIWMNHSSFMELVPKYADVSSTFLVKYKDSLQQKYVKDAKTYFTIQGMTNMKIPKEDFENQQSFMKSLLGLFRIFTNLATAIGIFGLMALMYRLIRERRQQLGMLRAIGFQTKDVYVGVVIEGSLMAALGITAGIGLGSYVGDFLIRLLFLESKDPIIISFPWEGLLWTWIGALLLVLITSMIPARQAVKLSPAEATKYFQ